MSMTEEERRASRKATLRKYRISEKNKIVQKRYRDSHKKQCAKAIRAWHVANKDRVRAVAKIWANSEKGKELRKEIHARYAAKNRHKRLAKDAVNNTIKRGKMAKSCCVVCGDPNTQGHHEDYSKPLSVVWLCHKHHVERHYKND